MRITRIDVNKALGMYDKNNSKTENIKMKNNKQQKDSIQISKVGRELSAIDINDSKIESGDKVEKIKKQIENGTYKVDSKLIAKKMIDIMKGRE